VLPIILRDTDSEHEGKPFYDKLISFITSAPVFAMVVEGENAVAVSRKIIGSTNPSEAAPGMFTIMFFS
jgi:nucleoside-diphosphate kinase